MGPKIETLAFRIWQYAEPLGWDATVQEIAEHLDVNSRSVRSVLKQKGWYGRVRTESKDTTSSYKDEGEALWD